MNSKSMKRIAGRSLLGAFMGAWAIAMGLAGCSQPTAAPVAATPRQAQPADAIHHVSPAEAAAMIRSPHGKAVVILDVRELDEYQAGHLAGAKLLPSSANDTTLRGMVKDYDRGRRYVLYCVAGARAGRMAQRLADMGFRDLAVVKGGFLQLEAQGLPVER